ncbi:hypothetical protein [Methylobacterium indicum]|uniref:hypothetical protein n=1 Tax=Methylobacterium indicum TaxID=1775910 RepID=UPI000A7D85E5|nr:hypothetical protein [Methylobacterium indicum]
MLALVLTLPRSKFVHGLCRSLVRDAQERAHHAGAPAAEPVAIAATTGQGGQRR